MLIILQVSAFSRAAADLRYKTICGTFYLLWELPLQTQESVLGCLAVFCNLWICNLSTPLWTHSSESDNRECVCVRVFRASPSSTPGNVLLGNKTCERFKCSSDWGSFYEWLIKRESCFFSSCSFLPHNHLKTHNTRFLHIHWPSKHKSWRTESFIFHTTIHDQKRDN